MADHLSGRALELVQDKNFATVATLRKDGSVQANVVWVHARDGSVLVNSAEGRAWPANLRRDPRVTVTVPNWEKPYEYVTISGKAAEMTHEGADEDIDMLAKKYLDADTYPFRQEGEQRVTIRIEPDRVKHYGG
jgi:PPOX class probable F420-dependent enzyme